MSRLKIKREKKEEKTAKKNSSLFHSERVPLRTVCWVACMALSLRGQGLVARETRRARNNRSVKVSIVEKN